MNNKPESITPEEVDILATLMTGDETVRLWARRMGITHDVVSHPRLRELYDALLTGMDITQSPRLMEIVDRSLPWFCAPHRTLFEAVKYWSHMPGFEARLIAFQRGARKRVSAWAPEVLRFVAKRIEAGAGAKEVQYAAELLAFAAWTPQHDGPWVYHPGQEVSQ